MICDLSKLGLSAEALEARRFGLGGSDATKIMGGDPATLLALWEQKLGISPPDDLSDNLAVQMGSWSEALNAAWFTARTGVEITDRGEVRQCSINPWRRATLDGLCGEAVWEAKHVNARSEWQDVVARYYPQLHHLMSVCGLRKAHLSIFRGSNEWKSFLIDYDGDYGDALLVAEYEFWVAVESGAPPVPYPAPPPPTPAAFRQVDMSGSNQWGASAADFLETADAYKRHDKAKKALRDMTPSDAARAHGYGVEAVRDGRGVTVKPA